MATQRKGRSGGNTARTILAKHGFQDVDKGNSDHDLACQFLGLPEQMSAVATLLYPSALKPEPHKSMSDYKWPDPNGLLQRLRALGLSLAGGTLIVLGEESGFFDVAWDTTGAARLSDRHAYSCPMSRPTDAPKTECRCQEPRRAAERTLERAAPDLLRWADEITDALPLTDRSRREVVTTWHSVQIVGEDPSFEVPINKGNAGYKTTVGFADLIFGVKGVAKGRRRWEGLTVVDDVTSEAPLRPVLVEVKAALVSGAEILRQLNLYYEYLDEPHGLVAATLFDLTADDAAMLRSQGIYPIKLGAKFQAWKASRGGKATDVEEL